jgi:uncharacterized protein (DUF2345 family)
MQCQWHCARLRGNDVLEVRATGASIGLHRSNVVPAQAGTPVCRAAKKYFMAAAHKGSHLKKTDLAARSF